jgi:hypothetical protein
VAKTVRDHIDACKRQIQELRLAVPIIIPESNMAVALDLQYQLKTVMGVHCYFMTEDNDKASAQPYDMPGSQTTAQNKPVMIRLLRQMLEQRRVVFHSDFVVANELPGRSIQKEFISQMRNFAEILKIREGPDGAPVTRTWYTGKAAGGNDDFVITLALVIYMYQVFEAKDKYAGLR